MPSGISETDTKSDPAVEQEARWRAGAYLAERSDILVAIYGAEGNGQGAATAQIVTWRQDRTKIPRALSSLSDRQLATRPPKIRWIHVDPIVKRSDGSHLGACRT